VLRIGLDYLRFVDPRYDSAAYLRTRAEERAPRLLRWLTRATGLRDERWRAIVRNTLAWLEGGIPVSRTLGRFIAGHAPDVVVITPLIDLGTPQLDHLVAARAAGRRTMLCVGSWDHLSSKALIRVLPDRVTVWNDTQKREAVELHGVPGDRVVVTGAQCFDRWFDRAPARDRETFCRHVGLDASRPFILYVCSSLFSGTGAEADVVHRWIETVRSSTDPQVCAAGILVRPHPARLAEWAATDLSGHDNLVVHGSNPVDDASRDDYFDSLFHSAAVVGLNTTALIEAGIVGRPVHTFRVPEVSDRNQDGTLHFRYLLEVGGGLVQAAPTLAEHVAHLSAALNGRGESEACTTRFVEEVVRPFGINVPGTPRIADAIESVARLGLAPAAGISPWSAWSARLFLAPWLVTSFFRYRALDLAQEIRKELRRRTRYGVRNTGSAFSLAGWRAGREVRRLGRAVRRPLRRLRGSLEHAGRASLRRAWQMVGESVRVVRRDLRRLAQQSISSLRRLPSRTRRLGRRGVYEIAMLTHRLGLRGRGSPLP
jgi:hypothetical protein